MISHRYETVDGKTYPFTGGYVPTGSSSLTDINYVKMMPATDVNTEKEAIICLLIAATRERL